MKLALFDLDGTLLPIDSDHAFGEFMMRIGWADGSSWRARNQRFYEQYLSGELDLAAYVDFATSAWRHRPIGQAEAARARFMVEVIEPHLHANARALVCDHQAAGDVVAIVTATNEFVTSPIAAAFDVRHLLAVKLARDAAGRVTGAIEGVPTFREGKVVRVRQWLAAQGWRMEQFDDVLFYSDSTNDLPLLEAVKSPVATNPSAALAAIAAARGWRVVHLFEAS